MHRNPERLAWTALLSSFFVWCALVTLVPLGARWWLLNAAADQTVTMTSTGTVLVTRPGRAVGEANLVEIPIGSKIITKPDAQATLTFISADGREVVATIQVYGNTELIISRANSPRYSIGANPNHIDFDVAGGRVRGFIGTDVSRPVVIRIFSRPDALTIIEQPGSNASVEVSLSRAVVTVREGEAVVIAQGQGIPVPKDQRAEVAVNEPPAGPLPAERNLIANGDFQQALNESWLVEARQPQDPNEDWGMAEIATASGRRAINLTRTGRNWGEVGITQAINQDVRDFSSLRLQLDLLIAHQDLYNCGQQGTECPVMVKIRYTDTGGGEREWLQGFYYNYNAASNIPRGCPSCAPPVPEHKRVIGGQWATYESDNLLATFRAIGLPAATIKSLTIYGSGHTFESLVTDVQLLAAE